MADKITVTINGKGVESYTLALKDSDTNVLELTNFISEIIDDEYGLQIKYEFLEYCNSFIDGERPRNPMTDLE